MSFVRKAMLYLGLEDGDYEDYGPEPREDHDRRPGRERDQGPSRHQGPPSAASGLGDDPSGIGSVRPIGTGRTEGATVQPTGSASSPLRTGSNPARPRPQVVRPIAVMPNAKPHVVTPVSFGQAQEVADKYKGSQPVIMNLQGADRELSRRLIDFASGLCYGLGGQMERVANQVYLLTPTNVEVSAEERRRLHERGYDS
jgi:cell division inhibitor SepF